MKDTYLYKDYEVGESGISFKDIDGKKGIVTGYFAAFDNVDADGDIIRKGAFEKTIKDNGPKSATPRIKHLMNHDTSSPLGVITELKEDTKGLYYESKLGTHELGRDFVKMVESGLITEHSIGYRIIKRNQLQDYEGYQKDPESGWFELKELKLWEGSSLTAWGANMYTPLTGMKAEIKIQNINNRIDLLCKALRKGELTEETYEMLEIELQQLKQFHINLLKDSQQASQAANTIASDSVEMIDNIDLIIIDSFIKTLPNNGKRKQISPN
jgi:HK97 family phage prohead protease